MWPVVSANNRIVSIVEDDPSTILFFHEALKSFSGITIFTFRDPVLALKHFQDYDYAYVLVISDFKTRGLNGMELLKNIKESNQLVRTILITAAFRIDDNIFQEFTKKKIINGFIQKPISLHDFLKEVDTQLQSYEIQKKYPSY
jgi:two-component system, cell cycle response regulator CpdR